MVKKLSFFLLYIIFFMASLLFFLPKVELYYLLEQTLKNHEIVLYNEVATDEGFSLQLEGMDVAAKGVKTLSIEKTEIAFYGIYNTINAHNIQLSSALQSFVPLAIIDARITYTALNPLSVSLHAQGDFGELHGELHLLESELRIHLIASEQMKKGYAHALKEFKRDENGEYDYAKKF